MIYCLGDCFPRVSVAIRSYAACPTTSSWTWQSVTFSWRPRSRQSSSSTVSTRNGCLERWVMLFCSDWQHTPPSHCCSYSGCGLFHRLWDICLLWCPVWHHLHDQPAGHLCRPIRGDHQAPADHPLELQAKDGPGHHHGLALLAGLESGSSSWLE